MSKVHAKNKDIKTTDIVTFKEFCEMNLSNYHFNRLHEVAKVSKHMITIMLNNPPKMTFQVLVVVSIDLERKPLSLVEKYDCGLDTMTAREYRKLLQYPFEKKEQ